MKAKTEIMWGLWHPENGWIFMFFRYKKQAFNYRIGMSNSWKVVKVKITEVKKERKK